MGLESLMFAVALLSGLGILQAYGLFNCPQAEMILPCQCDPARSQVKCRDVHSLEIVQKALEDQFTNTTLPSLKISSSRINLISRAFENIPVRKLRIENTAINGIHEDAFRGQDRLESLVLEEDHLFDVPTLALKRISNLKTLSLYGNRISKIESESFDDLKELKYLTLSDNNIHIIERNAFPIQLDTLAISRSMLHTFNESLNHLTNLEWLMAERNVIASVKGELDGLIKLKHLKLSYNRIYDISESFDHLRKLVSLDLSYNYLEAIGKSLKATKNLQRLDLSYNNIAELDENSFKNLGNLQHLDLSGNKVMTLTSSPSSIFSALKQLRHLNLSHNRLNRLELDVFEGMSELRTLDLSRNQLASNLGGISGHYLPKLTNLLLHHNRLEILHQGLKSLKNLQDLDVGDNQLSRLNGNHLVHNKNLKSLKLGGNPLTCSDILTNVLRELESRNVRISGGPYCYDSENEI